jgi:uncharacterized protein (DUF342 family)
MKKKYLLMISPFLILGALTTGTGCNTASDKVENAQAKVEVAKEKLQDANESYLTEVESFKLQTAGQIAKNEEALSSYIEKARIQKSENKIAYEKKVGEMNDRNIELKSRMINFKSDTKSNWELFKIQYSIEMDDLKNSINDFKNK